jgi:hypothetical protein
MKLEQLHSNIDCVAGRISRDRFLRRTAFAFFLAAAAALGLWTVWTQTQAEWLGRNSALLAASLTLLFLLTVLLFRRCKVNRHTAARTVENEFPDLNQRLLAALEQQPSVETGRLNYLQNQVVGEALEHARSNDWLKVMPTSRLASSALLQFAGLALFATTITMFWLRPPAIADVHRSAALLGQTTVAEQLEFGVTIEPGDVELERGTDLLVLARFDRRLPSDVALIAADSAGKPNRVPLSKSLDDPVFGGRLREVRRSTSYHIEFDGRRTREFRITVFDFPALEQLDAVIQFPDYTCLPETTLEDTRRVSVVEGSQITLVGRANKPIAAVRLIDENDLPIAFEFISGSRDRFELTLTATKNQRYELQLIDEQDRHNKFPQEVIIEVTPNRRPEIRLAFPAKDIRVSPIEELSLEASTWDDFGVKQYGLIYGLAGQEPTTLVIGESVPGRAHRNIAHLLSFEQLGAKPDQLLSYYFFADDYGSDGKLRRSYSDMFFAEVRHFEEIFRQGQQPPGGASKKQGGGSPQSKKLEDLGKLQKQIVNATWKIIRRETSAQPSETFAADVQLISDSQQSALDQLRKLEQKLKDPKSRGYVTSVVEHMTKALDALQESINENDASRLTAAISSEQSAYQGLLKLRAREHKVSKNKSGGGGGGGSSRSQNQMNQLELSNKENRYQTKQKAADNKASAENREQLQVLNRLRDLARRQQGLNDKLKELDNALREAKTEQQREEIRRRLKRLRDEQQEMLRDVDKLRNRMDRPENQQKMADDLRKLDQTREKIRQTSEALKQGQLSQAFNTGTRTERELKNLKEDFRKRTAGQFADEMKDIRDRSRAISEKQGELTRELKSLNDTRRRTLRDSSHRQKIARDMKLQKQNLDKLLDQASDVVRKAEQTEPLLTRKLYDTIRKARDDQPGKHLEAASELVDKGLTKEADDSQQQASRGIERIRKGIEQAAESVLGSEMKSLRTAKKELDAITKALKNEVAQSSARRQRTGGKPKQTAGRTQPSKAKNNPRQPGANNPQPKQSQPSSNPSNADSKSASGKSPSGKSASGKSQSPGQSSAGQSSSSGSGKSSGGKKPGLRGEGKGKSGKSQPGPLSSFLNQGGMSGGPGDHGGAMKPLTGDDFREWSDKLRDVEEMVEDPELRDDVARIRDRARSMRVEFKRHSREPNWDLVRDTILQPLVQLQQRLAEEIARRESSDALVPIDREPVQDRFSDLVEQYYKRLGQGDRRDGEIRR